MEKKEIKKIELATLVFIILLLVNLPLAHSYIINQGDSQKIPITSKENNGTNQLIKLLKAFFSIRQIGTVSAADFMCCAETKEGDYCKDVPLGYDKCVEGKLEVGSCISNNCEVYTNIEIKIPSSNVDSNAQFNCCPEMVDGSVCQDILDTTPQFCAVPIIQTKCELTSNCKKGCCIDQVEGTCDVKATKQKCENNGGTWNSDEDCNIAECQKGCCVLGSNVDFVTEQRCEYLSLIGGFEKDFRDFSNQLDCLALAETQTYGACIEDDVCKFKANSECSGDFHENTLCSNPSLETGCEKQSYIGCAEGKNEIYWFDSCGNRENIYSSNKDASWNNGEVLPRGESCNPNGANGNAGSSDCGNCLWPSSVCSSSLSPKVRDGNFVCKDLSCTYKGKKYSNGESWCSYDSYIGGGKDAPGSRHWVQKCVDGEVISEGCADYRGELCTQNTIEENGKTFSLASCVPNEGVACINYNSEDSEDMKEKCDANKHCEIKSVNLGEYFRFDLCTPKYPKGFNLEDTSGINVGVCAIASQTCNVVWVKDLAGHWKCEENCDCETEAFAKQMNELCIGLGDCGSYVNYIGEGTDNSEVYGNPSNVKWEDYKKYSTAAPGQYVEPQDLERNINYLVGDSTSAPSPDGEAAQWLNQLGQISGGLGALIYLTYTTEIGAGIIYSTPASWGIVSAQVGAFAGAAIGFGLGAMAGGYLASSLGIQDRTAATTMMLAGGVAGAALGYASMTGGVSALGGASATSTTLLGLTALGWTAVIALAVMAYIAIIGWGETEVRPVKFECMPWQPPNGGDDCEKCNDDPLKPCTPYRCNSLGQTCEILNENTENPICVGMAYENNPPAISLGVHLNNSYEFRNEEPMRVEIRQNSGDCIPEWTPVIFTMETDEYAQCRYGFNDTDNYEDLTYYPLEATTYSTNHTFHFRMPSIGSLEANDVSGDWRAWFADANLYVRCQDGQDPPNFNLAPYVINFCINSDTDITPAYIKKYSPEDKSYIRYNQTEQDIMFWINEPAQCRYDFVSGKDYDSMKDSFNCETGFNADKSYWACTKKISNLTKDENNIYIKCRDKPWVNSSEEVAEYGERNVNSEDFVYTLYGSNSELKIDSVKIINDKKTINSGGVIESGFEPISVELEVKTSGGADNGNSACYWGENFDSLLLETYSNVHRQKLADRMRGDYDISLKCVDDAGNIAYGNAVFEIEVDSSPPVVVRVYREGSRIRIITDEDADCYYDFNKCNFNIDNATSMTTGISNVHSAEWILGKTYHIKCSDTWGNTNPGCAIQISPSFFG